MRIFFLLFICICAPSRGFAQFKEIESNDYALEIHNGVALGSLQSVGMGGTNIATAMGSESVSANPAAVGVRTAHSNSIWAWSAHFSLYNPDLGDDFDNNGIDNVETSAVPFATFGIGLQYKTWGLGFNIEVFSRDLSQSNDMSQSQLAVQAARYQVTLSRSFYNRQFILGIGLRAAELLINKSNNDTVFSTRGQNIEAGLIYKPKHYNLRHGLTIRLPVTGNIETSKQDSYCIDENRCFDFPRRVRIPAVVSYGFAYRWAPTSWNKGRTEKWRDERALLWATDVRLVNSNDDTYGLEAFTRGQLQPSGRSRTWSLGTGVEYELIPSWFRIRAGSYWEPGRFKNESGNIISGRVHGTAGVELRFWQFNLWGKPYRLRFAITGDVAKKYANTGLSIGFWN